MTVAFLAAGAGQTFAADIADHAALLGDEPVEDAITGVDFETVIVVDGGTVLDPEPGVGNKLIIATGAFAGPQTLGADRTVIGGGATIRVRGLKSGEIRTFTAPGGQPTTTSDSGPGLRIDGANVHVAGIRVRVTGDDNGVSGGSGKTNIAIEQMQIEIGGESRGIRFGEDNSNIRVMQNMVQTMDDGIRFGDGNRDVEVSGNMIAVSGNGQAIRFGDGNAAIRATGNEISAAGEKAQGIRVGADNTDVGLAGNTFGTVGGDVFVFAKSGNRLVGGSGGNVVTASPGGAVCDGSGGFEGALEVAAQSGDLLVFDNGCAR